MPETISLLKANPLLPAEDYAAMRKAGLKSIEQLGSATWTDYNTSDPGITLLEAVTYAITDLAYRTGFEVKDLLAPENLTENTWKQVFYTARQVLHNAPVTINDYRKLLIDIKGVRNAWIEPSKEYEVPLWIDYNYFELKNAEACSCKDVESQTCFGKIGLEAATAEKTKTFYELRLEEITKELLAEKNKIPLNQTRINLLEHQIKQLEKMRDSFVVEVGNKKEAFIPSKIVELEGLYNVMIEYEENVIAEERREEVRLLVLEKLAHHRNFCEDFVSVNAVEYEEFGIKTTIFLEEHADPDVVLAQIFFAIYTYFTPSVSFNTIQQLLEKGYTVDEIFEGPALKHGFIETRSLEQTDLFRDIRLSDIINQVSDIKGVKGILEFHITLPDNTYASGQAYFNDWILKLKEERKIARISPQQSQVTFKKDRDAVSYNVSGKQNRRAERMLKLFEDLKLAERNYKLEGTALDFPVPNGQHIKVDDYYPVTYSLPMCYGVSERAELPLDADEKRKVQALQLKGYLLFFEQLLAGHLVQLNHLRDLFTLDASVEHTYFNRALTEIDNLKALLIDHQNRGEEHFDLILKDFTGVLQNLLEPPELFHQRRNVFLNHFLARFSEDRSEYETLNRWLVPHQVEERLIRDKINLLRNGEYYKISTNRGKAYDYTQPDFWNTGNISGVERRLGRLLGFSNLKRRTLTPSFLITEPIMEQLTVPTQKKDKKGELLNCIKLLNPDNPQQVLLTSVEVAEGCCTEVLMNKLLEDADKRRNFKFHNKLKRVRKATATVNSFSFELWDGEDLATAVLLASSEHFMDREGRDAAYRALVKALGIINANEGFHLLEHLLLRPKLDQVLDEVNNPTPVSFLNVCLDSCDLGIGVNDKDTTHPDYKKEISRTPADKCYDKMPWVLKYKSASAENLLFQQTFADDADQSKAIPLKFRRYSALTLRIQKIQEFGSEGSNYKLLSNGAEEDALRYSFCISDDNNEVLAQSTYKFKKRMDAEAEIKKLSSWFGFEMDWYGKANSCDNSEDPYSLRAIAILPAWPKRFRDPTYKNLVEKTITLESPAHTHIRIIWLSMPEMQRFEKVYAAWLEEYAQTELPAYEKINPLVNVLNTLKPFGNCEDDCNDTHSH